MPDRAYLLMRAQAKTEEAQTARKLVPLFSNEEDQFLFEQHATELKREAEYLEQTRRRAETHWVLQCATVRRRPPGVTSRAGPERPRRGSRPRRSHVPCFKSMHSGPAGFTLEVGKQWVAGRAERTVDTMVAFGGMNVCISA